MQLVVMAAGMGSRFGGLKQMEPMDEAGNFLLDYSVYDAKKAGFDSVVFIIKREFYEIFRDSIGKRVSKIIKVDYAFQELTDLPEGFRLNEARKKPWGTAHAIYAARDLIHDDFIVINGDDFYGYDAYKVAYEYLSSIEKDKKGQYANVAFKVKNTMTENGSVKRGILLTKQDGTLDQLIESKVEKIDNEIVCTSLEKGNVFKVKDGTLVSMNLFAFSKDIIDELRLAFPIWLKDNANNDSSEFLIPTVVDELVHDNKASLKILNTDSVWFGVTYKEDKPGVVKALANLIELGVYKKGLY